MIRPVKWMIGWIALTSLISCNAFRQKDKSADAAEVTNTLHCFRYASARDTVTLNLRDSADGIFNGRLVYKLYEKDSNSGSISGRMRGDVFLADYTFNSEGVSSVRQVAFKKAGSTLREGFGDVTDENGRMVFVHPDSLNFDSQIVLKEVDCSRAE